jgi:hypothetical protein
LLPNLAAALPFCGQPAEGAAIGDLAHLSLTPGRFPLVNWTPPVSPMRHSWQPSTRPDTHAVGANLEIRAILEICAILKIWRNSGNMAQFWKTLPGFCDKIALRQNAT